MKKCWKNTSYAHISGQIHEKYLNIVLFQTSW
jgi:hypothetical protein